MPEVIVIDEIGTELEAAAARTIAERGVQLVATAHGNELENLIMNPTLSDLVGGIQSVTLGDEEARRRGTQKSILERKAPPTFDILVEIQSWEKVAVHGDVAETVDGVLRGYRVPAEVRWMDEHGEVQATEEAVPFGSTPLSRSGSRPDRGGRPMPFGGGARGRAQDEPEARIAEGPVRRIYPFGISRKRLEQAIRETSARAAIAEELDDADTVMTLRSYFRRKPQALRDAESRGLPIYVLKTNTVAQMEQGLVSMAHAALGNGDSPNAMQEAEDAINDVLNGQSGEIELTPQNAYIRRLQHQLAQRYNLTSRSSGREPYRRVRIGREDGGWYQ
jgi:hypothetical protein